MQHLYTSHFTSSIHSSLTPLSRLLCTSCAAAFTLPLALHCIYALMQCLSSCTWKMNAWSTNLPTLRTTLADGSQDRGSWFFLLGGKSKCVLGCVCVWGEGWGGCVMDIHISSRGLCEDRVKNRGRGWGSVQKETPPGQKETSSGQKTWIMGRSALEQSWNPIIISLNDHSYPKPVWWMRVSIELSSIWRFQRTWKELKLYTDYSALHCWAQNGISRFGPTTRTTQRR